MKRYQAIPHAIFSDNDGYPVHYDPENMQFTEMSDLHVSILNDFENVVGEESLPTMYAEVEAKNALDELMDNNIISSMDRTDRKCEIEPFSPNIVAFRVVLTEKCNLKCAECFVTKNVNDLTAMSQNVLDEVIKKISQYGEDKTLTIHFFGGEPLICFDFIERAVRELNLATVSGRIIQPRYSITTNATLIDKKKATFFQKNHFRVAVSIDGDEDLHDKLRPNSVGAGSYDSAKTGYRKLLEANVKPSIIITPHPQYIDDLKASLENIIDEFAPSIITINVPFDYETLSWSADGEEYAKFLMYAMELCRKEKITLHSAIAPIIAALSNYAARNSPCSMLCNDIMVSVRTDGKMSFCAQKWHDKMARNIPTSEEHFTIPLKLAIKCKTCIAYSICGGPCPAFQMISGRTVDTNKCNFMESILREIAKHLNWFE